VDEVLFIVKEKRPFGHLNETQEEFLKKHLRRTVKFISCAVRVAGINFCIK